MSLILNFFVIYIHKKTTNIVDNICQKNKCIVSNAFEPNSNKVIIKISILIMFAIKIMDEPNKIIFRAFFIGMSTEIVKKINNRYADAAVHAGMKFS